VARGVLKRLVEAFKLRILAGRFASCGTRSFEGSAIDIVPVK